MTIQNKEITVSLGQLMLDPNNYRLNKGEDFTELSDDNVIKCQADIRKKLVKENVSDLENSILKNGFLEVDKIVVRELVNISKKSNLKKYIVIEGNRRTAAFKSIISEYYNEKEEIFADEFPEQLKKKYQNINVILVEGESKEIKNYSQRLMGIRHVSGPRQWGGYQSAKLINDMIQDGQNYKKIGSLLGMRPIEAQRRHESFLAFNQMKDDPLYTDKADPKLFSLFSEIVGASKYFKEDWLGWNDEVKVFENKRNLYRTYDSIVPNADGVQEVKNPSRLRAFAKAIITEEVREQIQSGVLLDDIDYDYDAESRIKNLIKFIKTTKNLNEVSGKEKELYIDLKKIIGSLLEKESD